MRIRSAAWLAASVTVILAAVAGAAEARLLAEVEHVAGERNRVVRLYSNCALHDPESRDTWYIDGRKLVLLWVDANAPGGAWIDRCVIEPNGLEYRGKSQQYGNCSGRVVTGNLLSMYAGDYNLIRDLAQNIVPEQFQLREMGRLRLRDGKEFVYVRIGAVGSGVYINTPDGKRSFKWEDVEPSSLPARIRGSRRQYLLQWLQEADILYRRGQYQNAYTIYRNLLPQSHFFTEEDRNLRACRDFEKRAEGKVELDGEWVDIPVVLRARGYVEYGGDWVTEEQHEFLLAAGDIIQQYMRRQEQAQGQDQRVTALQEQARSSSSGIEAGSDNLLASVLTEKAQAGRVLADWVWTRLRDKYDYEEFRFRSVEKIERPDLPPAGRAYICPDGKNIMLAAAYRDTFVRFHYKVTVISKSRQVRVDDGYVDVGYDREGKASIVAVRAPGEGAPLDGTLNPARATLAEKLDRWLGRMTGD